MANVGKIREYTHTHKSPTTNEQGQTTITLHTQSQLQKEPKRKNEI